MSSLAKVFKYELRDVARARAVAVYGLFLLLATEALFRFSGVGPRALLSMVNVILFLVPLVSVILGTVYVYNSREFNELLLSHPVGRRELFGGLYLGLAVPLSLAVLVGILLPAAWHGALRAPELTGTLALLAGAGAFLTFIFVALAFVIAVRLEDRVRGLATALVLWLVLAVLYDAAVLMAVNAFSAYPLEKPVLGMMLLNPIDLARVVLLMNFDVSALMGYTGAVFQKFFGGPVGAAVAVTALTAWVVAPLAVGVRLFGKKDF